MTTQQEQTRELIIKDIQKEQYRLYKYYDQSSFYNSCPIDRLKAILSDLEIKPPVGHYFDQDTEENGEYPLK